MTIGSDVTTSVGKAFLKLGDVSVTSYVRVNADETLSYLNASQFLNAIGGVSSSHNHDDRYYTETEADAAFLRQDSSETIASGVTWSSVDSKVATTAAIDARIIDLVEEVGGFVPLANETSFPTSNPDVNNGAGTIVSVQAASTNLVPSGTTVTIANGAGTGNTVTLTGVSAAIPSGFGFLVETTSTLHTQSLIHI